MADFAGRGESHEDVGPARQDFLKGDIQFGAAGVGGKEIGHAAFAGAGVVAREKGWIDTRQPDQLSQQSFSLRHIAAL